MFSHLGFKLVLTEFAGLNLFLVTFAPFFAKFPLAEFPHFFRNFSPLIFF